MTISTTEHASDKKTEASKPEDPSESPAQTHQYAAERARIDLRRGCLELDKDGPRRKYWALALSGGGIRSATFGLGVLQAMARAPAPAAIKDRLGASAVGRKLLPHFDYLSTVSGGGYIGSFFGSLFMPGRLSKLSQDDREDGVCKTSVKDAGKLAYKVLEFEPPGRIHTNKFYEFDTHPGDGPMAWLRENGRYLLPKGSGDFFYAVALSIRNFLAVHFVIGMPLLFLLTLCVWGKLWLAASPQCTSGWLFTHSELHGLICASLWWLPLAWFALAVFPLILAFWMIYPKESQEEKAKPANISSLLYVAAMVVFVVIALRLPAQSAATIKLLYVMAGVIGLGVIWQVLMIWPVDIVHRLQGRADSVTTVRDFRIRATRLLANALVIGGVIFFLILVTEAASEAYLALRKAPTSTEALPGYTPPVVLASLIVLIKKLAKLFDEKTLPAWLQKVPVEVLAGFVGVAMLFSLAIVWGMAVEWVRWNGQPSGALNESSDAFLRLTYLLGTSLFLTFSSGHFIGFLNLSSLHSFYSSRLSRAYLGASNRSRFKTFTTTQRRASDRDNRQLRSVADALPGDDLQVERYYGTKTCAPVHLINVTLNLTVDPGEQLVQRERKGKPLCLAPNFYPAQHDMDAVSYILDGEPRIRSSRHKWFSEINQPLTLSHWVATSGAAVTTGLGRATTLGTSLALGLANVRLGSWWPCNFIEAGEDKHARRIWKDNFVVSAFPTQAYLFYELTATFHGYRRDFQYLSDGGHFENTAAYELLRRGRNVELIVLCDSGCDQPYRFDDVANLIRLARIDHALEIEEDLEIQKHPVLGRVFFSMKEFADPKTLGPQGCAVMLDVYEKDRREGLRCKILVLKPRNIADLPADVQNYAKNHPAFPNEPTADQSFDEAQFESYRQLGLNMGQLLFGEQKPGQRSVAGALWDYIAACKIQPEKKNKPPQSGGR